MISHDFYKGHTFSVMFLHYLLSRQLVTEKEFELWWLYVGKPIRYAIQDFALVTGLNCGERSSLHGDANERGIGRGKGTAKAKNSVSIWDELFRGEEKPTVAWIMDRLVRGKKYKDPLTRLRLALLVLVEGILCPTCGTTNIRPEVVSKLADLDDFLKHPWRRESFLLTVRSTKSQTPMNYVQETMAIQGFSHAMVLVTITACPSIIIKSGGGDPLADSALSTANIITRVVERKLVVNLVTAKSVDQLGQAYVQSFRRRVTCHKGAMTVVCSLETGGGNLAGDRGMNLKRGHFNREVGALRTDLQSATTSIRELETAVTSELDNIKKLIMGPGYNDEEPPIGGGSPHRQYSPYRGAEHDAGDAFVPPAKLRADIRSLQTQRPRGLSPDPPHPSIPHTKFTDPLPPVSQSDTVPDVSGVVNQILSDAGISKELPRPSPAPATVAAGPSVSSKFVLLKEKDSTSHGGETHGSNPVEEASDLGVEKNDDVDGVLPIFIGGFNAFAPPTQANRDAFLKRLTATKYVRPCTVSTILGPLFHCNGVCSHEALNRVVNLIRNRRDRLPSAKFEFVPPSFFLELMRNYAGFEAIKEKQKFAFSTHLKPQFLHLPGWYTQVDFIYSSFLIKKTHWVGLIVDLKMSSLYVVDFNSACPYTVDVTSYLSPIATMLPHLVSRYCIVPSSCEMNFRPFPISRIEVPVLLEHPGFSAVAALILLEMATADQPLNFLSLSEEEVLVAAENYAIAALSMG
ncbi:unnamed protein product [Brassica oleracea var. botrytis]